MLAGHRHAPACRNGVIVERSLSRCIHIALFSSDKPRGSLTAAIRYTPERRGATFPIELFQATPSLVVAD